MPEAELFLLFICPLNRAGIRYVVGGSVAAIFYGEPRLTNDVDVVVGEQPPGIEFAMEPHTCLAPDLDLALTEEIKIKSKIGEGGPEKHLRDIRAMLSVSGSTASNLER